MFDHGNTVLKHEKAMNLEGQSFVGPMKMLDLGPKIPHDGSVHIYSCSKGQRKIILHDSEQYCHF